MPTDKAKECADEVIELYRAGAFTLDELCDVYRFDKSGMDLSNQEVLEYTLWTMLFQSCPR